MSRNDAEEDIEMSDITLKNSELYKSLEWESNKKQRKHDLHPEEKQSQVPKKKDKFSHIPANATCTTTKEKPIPDNIREIIYYNKFDNGPFKACLRAPKAGNLQNRRTVKTVDVGRMLFKSGIQYIGIERIGFNKWTITFANKTGANDAVNNKYLKQAQWEIFIPRAFVFRQVVIREIPTDVSPEELSAEFKKSNPNIPLKDSFRFKVRNRSADKITEENSFIDSESIKLTIRTSSDPRWVYLWKIRIPTSIYVPRLRVCFNCGLMNHPTKMCRNPALCLNCGEEKHSETNICDKPAACRSCKGPHRTFFKECPEFKLRKEINRIMAYENVDFRTAKSILNDNSKNHSTLERHNLDANSNEFPSLKSKPQPQSQVHSYAQISAKPKPKPNLSNIQARVVPNFFDQITLEEDLQTWEDIETALSNAKDISLLLKRLLKTITVHESLQSHQ